MPPPSGPAFDWESLLGLKGAAWLGGIALVIAGLFLVKLAYDHKLITPEVRLVALLLGGTGGLMWAELSLRRGYATTANAVSGAAIALLYVAFYAGRERWGLFPLPVAFLGMVLTTVVAGLLAVRYDAVFTAVLGLFGGFATPRLLSTGEDHPVALFGYVLLLNLGLLTVTARKRWYALAGLGLAGTFVIEAGWYSSFMTPEKTLIGLTAFLIFGVLYLVLPNLARDEDDLTLRGVAAVGACVPFLFGLIVAGDVRFAHEWPLLFVFLALLEGALAAMALARGRVGLLVAGAAAAAVVVPAWAARGIQETRAVWGPLVGAFVIAAIPNAVPRLADRLQARMPKARVVAGEVAGAIAATGFGVFGMILVLSIPSQRLWPFLVLLVALLSLVVERTGERRLPGIGLAGAAGLAVLTQTWFHYGTTSDTLLRDLAVPLLLAVAFSLIAGRRAAAPVNATEDEAGVVVTTAVGILGLFGCLVSTSRGDPLPLFAALVLYLVLFLVSGLRRDWTGLGLAGLLASALFFALWQESRFQAADLPLVLVAEAAFYLAFLFSPFAVARWKQRTVPWLTSALAGPVFLWPLYRAVTQGWGDAWIGLLPLVLAATSVAALAGVRRTLSAAISDASGSLRLLRFLALYGAIALAFVAAAIPLQLHRQWITVGWALEAVAVWWLFGRLPHPGLKYFGAILYVSVGVRLLFNWENVLRYQERGLPVVNWILYTYGVPAIACLIGAVLLKRAEGFRRRAPEFDLIAGDRNWIAPATSFLGLILIFVLINLEILDFFAATTYLELTMERQLARDLSMSVAWGIYAFVLLLIGLLRNIGALRRVSLGFLLLTVAKVFLYDLSHLTGFHRVLSFLGLGVALILVSLLYQRYIGSKERL